MKKPISIQINNGVSSISVFVLPLLLLFGISTYAQRGAVRGKVVDDKKHPIVGAVVEILRDDIRAWNGVTDIDGNFEINNLIPGAYTTKITYAYEVKTTKISVKPGDTYTMKVKMSVNEKGMKTYHDIIFKTRGSHPIFQPPTNVHETVKGTDGQ